MGSNLKTSNKLSEPKAIIIASIITVAGTIFAAFANYSTQQKIIEQQKKDLAAKAEIERELSSKSIKLVKIEKDLDNIKRNFLDMCYKVSSVDDQLVCFNNAVRTLWKDEAEALYQVRK